MPSQEEIFSKVQEALVDALGVDDDEVTLEATLTGDLEAESIDFLDIVFRLEKSFDIKIERGELNALTAMARTHGGETAPMDIGVTPGYEPGPDFGARFVPLSFHFWTRGLPERVPFHGGLSRVVHGANAVAFYYQKGFRSAWYQVTKSQHINQDPQDQTNPFPSMFIMLRGKAQAKIGGNEVTFSANEMMFVPAGVTHEFWNPHDEPAEMILLMFGEGA